LIDLIQGGGLKEQYKRLAVSELNQNQLLVEPEKVHEPKSLRSSLLVALASTTLIESCGGGGTSNSQALGTVAVPNLVPSSMLSLSQADAVRFLLQAGLVATDADIQSIQTNGKEVWINQQAALTSSLSRVDWLLASNYAVAANMNSDSGLNNVL
jgi:hypothetical protein